MTSGRHIDAVKNRNNADKYVKSRQLDGYAYSYSAPYYTQKLSFG
jgi:hypothetical protein